MKETKIKEKKFRKVVKTNGMGGNLIFILVLLIEFLFFGVLFVRSLDFYLLILFLCLGGLVFQFIRMVYNYFKSREVYWREIK